MLSLLHNASNTMLAMLPASLALLHYASITLLFMYEYRCSIYCTHLYLTKYYEGFTRYSYMNNKMIDVI